MNGPKDNSKPRVVMAKAIAEKWLAEHGVPEYRLRVLGGGEVRVYARLLRAFRDGKFRLGSVKPFASLGVKEDFDGILIWSSDREGLKSLQSFFEKKGHETDGIWRC